MKRTYTQEEKLAIINRYTANGETSASIVADTGIPKSTFYSLQPYSAQQAR